MELPIFFKRLILGITDGCSYPRTKAFYTITERFFFTWGFDFLQIHCNR